MEDDVIEIKQILVGLKPYLLIEIQNIDRSESGKITNIDLTVSAGGGIDDRAEVVGLLEITIEQIQKDLETEA